MTNAIYSQYDIVILKSWLRIALKSKSKEEAAEIVINNKIIIEESIAEAVKEGERIGKAELIINQLGKKFKVLPDDYKNKIKTLPEKAIEEIGMQIFDMEYIEELDKLYARVKLTSQLEQGEKSAREEGWISADGVQAALGL